ncbi:hypothetical protein HN51_029303 [Arachis hypogaea]|uniref:uncharacterized protein isoform X2 n=1 Tax=Arachis hypogaea TaxID=3818 RepID=UPI000DEC0A9A|nr:transcription factor bHLH84 isoform X2 [Arachis hypogaea]QHO35901.1 Transcription factor [Arachis hypogaea]
MEPGEEIYAEWSSLSGSYTAEEADFMNQFLSNCSHTQQLHANLNAGIPSALWYGHADINSSSFYAADASNNMFPIIDSDNLNDPLTNLVDPSLSTYTDKELGVDVIADKNVPSEPVSEPAQENITSKLEKPRKRSRSSNEILKNKKNVKTTKKPKSASISNIKEEDRCPGQGENLSCSCSEDDLDTCRELNEGESSSLSLKNSKGLQLNGKSRSSRGSATDPQSIYARRRRERINERLRILQNLVPNGTKVDISTMLEEAVQYVKFLQLQIKLLSSDDLWMYAPIAYNGMNIGLDFNITTPKQNNNSRYIA